jgi:hypothetical protein
MIVFKNVEDYCGNHCFVCVLLTFYGNVLCFSRKKRNVIVRNNYFI